MKRLRREDIYDCLDDDEAFALLPGLVAETIGARSAVFHWRSEGGGPLVLADSGYWSPARMEEYVATYAEHDIWAQSTLTARTCNRLWVIDELVPERVYGNSVFYNDWIRTMGDDTYHCAGMSMAGPTGTGLIGLHRAKASGAFETSDLARLGEHVRPIQRLMRVRGMLAEASGGQRLVADVLDRMAVEVMVVAGDSRLLHANAPASGLLASGDPLTIAAGRVTSRHHGTARAILAAIGRATNRAGSETSFVRIALADGRTCTATVAPVRHEGRRCAMVMLRRPDTVELARYLRSCFGVTAAEAAVAMNLSQGMSVAAIAASRQVSPLTVRSQLKAVMDKLGCSRQAEVVALLAGIEPTIHPVGAHRGA